MSARDPEGTGSSQARLASGAHPPGPRASGKPQLGALFPQTEIERDPAAIRDYSQAVEGLGLTHLLLYDHVVSVDVAARPDFAALARRDGSTAPKPYDLDDPFHEVMVLMGFLAGITGLDFCTSILILPQRQTALVAKQAAEVDILTGGRLRLGVGVGWNRIEAEALGSDFDTRGRRLEEQVALLREYWTQRSVNRAGPDGHAGGVGLSPRPVQQPIPVWMAGGRDRALDRVGRLADGWLPVGTKPRELGPAWETVRAAAARVGRDPDLIGMEGRLTGAGLDDISPMVDSYQGWCDLGASHLALDTMAAGLRGAAAHVTALECAVAALRAA
jgi:probable F420-dependent oxidoreductase